MMAVHESGHVLAGMIGGGHVRRVVLPPLGFSRTDVDPNPSPRLEIWAGPLWGIIVPLSMWVLGRKQLSRPLDLILSFFAGLCLVANGAYLAASWMMSAGDAAELMKRGVPVWVLVGVGLPTMLTGFYVWHGMGSITALFAAPK